MNAAFENSSLATLDIKLRYVPIIMPDGMRERYPARSKVRKKERIYDCAPQLDFEVFVTGTFEDQVREYVHGFADAEPCLRKLGASDQQIEDFNKIVAKAVGRIASERLSQTRH